MMRSFGCAIHSAMIRPDAMAERFATITQSLRFTLLASASSLARIGSFFHWRVCGMQDATVENSVFRTLT